MSLILVRRSTRLAALAALALTAAACGDARGSAPPRKAAEPPKVYVEMPIDHAPGSPTLRSDRMLTGDGRPFTVTGSVPCIVVAGDADDGRSCAIGVVRTAPGAAEVWVAIGDGHERQITFANGQAVRSNGPGQLTVETTQGRFKIHVGAEQYEIPVAVVTGEQAPSPRAAPRRPRPTVTPTADRPAAAPSPAPAAPAPAAEPDSPPI